MPGKDKNKDFQRPAKDPGHKWQGLHSTAKEGSKPSPRLMQNLVKEPITGAGKKALKGGATRGVGGSKPKGPGPQHGSGKTKVQRGKKTR